MLNPNRDLWLVIALAFCCSICTIQVATARLEQHTTPPLDKPQVKHICAVASDMLALEIQSGQFTPNQLLRYEPQPGDEPLDETSADLPECYEIQSTDDPAYRQPQKPIAVYRKGKPNGYSQPLPYLYTISLRLPAPLREGATYTIFLRGLNTAPNRLTYTHRARTVRSLAIHAIQTGYRPDDPYKRAYYSFWAGVDKDGKNGFCSLSADTFELIDETGRTVFTGKVQVVKREGEQEQVCFHETGDYSKSPVYRLDFSSFRKPGRYRVFVPGVGTSYPFRIAEDVWKQPFLAAMQGVLHQRQGMQLGPPFTRYRRQRPFHPDDGVQFYQMTITVQEGQEDARGQIRRPV